MGQKMKKIFICGSAGFLMSNFMRYMLYRTKDYEFTSIDNSKNVKSLYQHKKHTFHWGDAGNCDLIQALLNIEEPDVVIIGTTLPFPEYKTNCENIKSILLPTATICDHNFLKSPYIIRLVPDMDIKCSSRALWNDVEAITLKANGTVLRLPVCFGRRGKGKFEEALKNIILQTNKKPDTQYMRVANANDVASLLWYLIENPMYGNVVRMPHLGFSSPLEMVNISVSVHGISYANTNMLGCRSDIQNMGSWLPDSTSLEEAVVDTAKWFIMNKWITNI